MDIQQPTEVNPYMVSPWAPAPWDGVVRRTFWLPVSGLQYQHRPEILGALFEVTDDWETMLGRYRRALGLARKESTDVQRLVVTPPPGGLSWVVGTHDDVCAMLERRWEALGVRAIEPQQWANLRGTPVTVQRAYDKLHVTSVGVWFTTADAGGYETVETDVIEWPSLPGFEKLKGRLSPDLP